MLQPMLSAYEYAVTHDLIGDVRLGVDLQYSPWDTRCFMAAFYLEFVDQSGKTGERDWLYLAAFVAHPANSAFYNRAVEHGKKNAGASADVNLVAALHFIQNEEVNCVYADPDMFPMAVDLHPQMQSLSDADPLAWDRSLLPNSVLNLRDMLVQEIESGHGYWRAIWTPRLADALVSGPAWFF